MKNIKNIFKKNQVIIAALAIMIIVAGYLNFTKGKIDNAGGTDVETNANISEDQLDIADGEEVDDDGRLVVTDDEQPAEKVEAENGKAEDDKAKESSKEEAALQEENEKSKEKTTSSEKTAEKSKESSTSNTGEAVLANDGVESDYFVSNKLKREQTRSKNEETLNGIINNSKSTDKQRQDAIDQMIALTDIKEKESVTETLLEAKGFSDTLVTINDGKVEVVVNANNLTEQEIAQIEDVVKRKTGIAAKNIVITPVKVSAAETTETKTQGTEQGSETSEDTEKSEKSE